MASAQSTARELVDLLKTRELTVATCESLTAGLAAAMIADIAGASAVLRGGLITYATDVKGLLAGVDKHILADSGPVSPVTAEQMALGARAKVRADFALSLTGVAGPDPQDGHEVGEVFLSVAGPESVRTQRVLIDGDRPAIRQRAAELGFRLLIDEIREQTDEVER